MNSMLALMGAYSSLLAIILGVFYVLKSIGLSTLAANRGIANPWVAWIPVADLYIMGMLVEKIEILDYHLNNLGLWFPVIVVGGAILSGIPVFGFLTSIAMFLFSLLLVYKLFEMYTNQAVLYTVLSVLLGLFPVFVFIIRNNKLLTSCPFQPSSGL